MKNLDCPSCGYAFEVEDCIRYQNCSKCGSPSFEKDKFQSIERALAMGFFSIKDAFAAIYVMGYNEGMESLL